jgi:subfamily B ATP-binding cassette protein MsbA
MEILAGIGLALVFVYAAGQIRQGLMTVGGLLSFLSAILMLYKPLKDVTRTNIVLQVALASAGRLFDVLDAENEIRQRPGAGDLARFAKEIRYEGVSFAYDAAAEPALAGIDLAIRRGETVAIVGPSGAGKTTLVNLLPRLYDPTAGRVCFDGVDLRDVTLLSLRRQIGLVTQETILFDTTVAENIAYGEASPSPERLRAAARAAVADEFIELLPQGYDTPVGEGASRLSGGQRQRLAIARAIYKDAPILILDEATSQLDTESEALIARALSNLMQGRTTLVIAHRLSTVRRADRIVVLESGRIREEGTHQQLLTLPGLYRRLHEMQYFAESAAALSSPAKP